ncbi:hypothetical protein CDL12_03113 [Handroanthus impetiginosus]|uniref:Uncharacterized protein n=1 Tax=Handroanthus impetiginosus TaxID=429701 RepID=A0A2G9I331_9LAMI|nr:hypothetical protein CDL12_03113 [Handroanthus impetiginosus]
MFLYDVLTSYCWAGGGGGSRMGLLSTYKPLAHSSQQKDPKPPGSTSFAFGSDQSETIQTTTRSSAIGSRHMEAQDYANKP